MSEDKLKKHTTRAIWIACILILLLAFGIPQVYRNYHSAPYCYSSGSQITLENDDTHKLNKYQKQQFTKIAKMAVDQKDGPFNWKNYRKVSLDVYKMKKPSEYGLIYKIKPVIRSRQHTITTSIIVKLNNRNLKSYHKFTIKGYSSDFSNFLD
ncbi:hypothetical protein LCR01_18020 [Companilactobacillus crustorum]|uniref:Uncharacterized protein n=3 Tax=Companilactobacillus TaxID=2767879 RepID=A0A837RJW2_9LACO|nr:hypothetical protein [Companilactobacillus crustorum]KRK44468.1 hypothetical protein FD26_GL000001 [Companilactobacillus crustorum JCM 15951]KRO21881.1 hypothetical protein IV63_GL000140 [Companilactobacillus crustorum]WDT65786.1 hypothetical protein NV391_00670 [Companilactobacillus crustorum]GEO77359.1 hypothetical protein LCR01_18020 [Companilactobacillus crustorum]